jgi:hypothetical protein
MHCIFFLLNIYFILASSTLQCNITYYPNDNFDGINLPNQPISTSCTSAADCAAYCCSTPGCTSFTLNAGYNTPSGSDCYLKSSITHRSNPGCISGIINGSSPSPPPPPPPPIPPSGFLDAVKDCGCDSTGVTDTTIRLQSCIDAAYGHTLPRVPVFLPHGVYLISDTISLKQDNPGGDDGINVVPGRFLPHVLIGEAIAASSSQRPVLKLASNSSAFSNRGSNSYTPVVTIFSDAGEGVDMNQLFKGIDIDLTSSGNDNACGISHPGAQGATVMDVTVRASINTFGCFCGLNGAGGMHANIRCEGARYGLYIDNSQPVPSGVGISLIGQSISAIKFFSQESLSLVGISILVFENATGPVIQQSGNQGMSLVDISITCASSLSNQIAVETTKSLYMRDVYIYGCATAIQQSGATTIYGPESLEWLHIKSYARGVDLNDYYLANVIYLNGERNYNGTVFESDSTSPPLDLISKHIWNETIFPDMNVTGVLNVKKDCGAKGDNITDDTLSFQKCLASGLGKVFVPPGLYRISDTLSIQNGGSLVGMNNAVSIILAATSGFPRATSSSPLPMIETSTGLVTIAHIGIVTWQHLDTIYTMNWQSQQQESIWRLNFESRDCECLWLSAYQLRNPTIVPCSLPRNLTIAKSIFSGLGRIYGFVNDDTGAILSTSASYRSLRINGSFGLENGDRLRFYSLNLEHAQSEANGEITNSSFVDIYSVKAEGNSVILWVKSDTQNISILAFGGDPTAFPFNFTYPSDFVQLSPSLIRVDKGAKGTTLAMLLDHGSGASPPYWPPKGGGCTWGQFYPYPGESITYYPYWTFPNVTMWNCWYGQFCSTSFYYQVSDGLGQDGLHSQFLDKPVYFTTL